MHIQLDEAHLHTQMFFFFLFILMYGKDITDVTPLQEHL